MRIAILGIRGVPGRYGGFETFAEELGSRLAERGHDVTVYCRGPRRSGARFKGMRLITLPAVRNKHLETLSHTLVSALHAATRPFDIAYICNSANAPICVIPIIRGQRVVLNVDGLEWERQKWGRVAKAYYRLAARLAASLPVEVVTDASVIQEYYARHFGRATRCIPYGTDLYERGHRVERLSRMDLEPEGYLLYVSRLEPENNALLVVQAYAKVNTDLPLVVVGDAPYARDYIDMVRHEADPRVRFLGYRFGEDYHALQANARLYIQATEVGGTHPALVEAMGHGNAIVAHDVPEHREVLGEAGRYFGYRDADSLTTQVARLLDGDGEIQRLRSAAVQRVRERYTWEAVTNTYEQYFGEVSER